MSEATLRQHLVVKPHKEDESGNAEGAAKGGEEGDGALGDAVSAGAGELSLLLHAKVQGVFEAGCRPDNRLQTGASRNGRSQGEESHAQRFSTAVPRRLIEKAGRSAYRERRLVDAQRRRPRARGVSRVGIREGRLRTRQLPKPVLDVADAAGKGGLLQ